MTGERSWTECATQVMEGKEEVWFTVQVIVGEIRQRNMKPSMHNMPANESCRSLRSCLRHHAKKENGRFVRKNSGTLIQYAIRKGVEAKERSTQTARKTDKSDRKPDNSTRHATSVGVASSVGGAVVVQVDCPDDLLWKTNRVRQPSRDSVPGPPSTGFLLPSPSSSLLGPRRTLSLLAAGESSSGRPVRRTRGRPLQRERARDRTTTGRSEETTPHGDIWLPPASLPDPHELGPFLSREGWSVAFLKSQYQQPVGGAKADHTPNPPPSHIQGDRVFRRVLCEVNPDASTATTSDLSSNSNDSETDTSSETEATPIGQQHMDITTATTDEATPTPGAPSHLLLPHLPSTHKQAPPPTAAAMAAKRSEVSRQLVHLLSPSSPLVSENLKVLLGQRPFDSLSQSKRHSLVELLPSVDRDPSHRLQPVALSNSFFGSACREWQDQLALGLHGNITACGRRGDKRPRNCSDWKDKYYELEWGERGGEVEKKSGSIFFPLDHAPPFSGCLSSIMNGYKSRPAPLHPSPPPLPPSLPTPPRPQKPVIKSLNRSAGERRPGQQRSPHIRHTPSNAKTKRDLHSSSRNNKTHSSLRKPVVVARNHVVLSNKNRISLRSSLLSPLPHKMSYTALIDALHKASRHNNNMAPQLTVTSTNSDLNVTSVNSDVRSQHTHSVFHDHFSTLSSSSLPAAFLSSCPLVVSLPLSLHDNLLRHRVVLSDHNYTSLNSDPKPTSLPLSLPRSLLPSPPPPPPHSSSSCTSQKLALCSTCNSLYHLHCSHGNHLCPSCTRPLS